MARKAAEAASIQSLENILRWRYSANVKSISNILIRIISLALIQDMKKEIRVKLLKVFFFKRSSHKLCSRDERLNLIHLTRKGSKA
jgi:hypothetical protein